MKHFIKEFGKAVFIGLCIFLVLGIIQYLSGYRFDDPREVLISFAYNQAYTIVLYLANSYFFVHLLNKYPNDLFKTEHLTKGIIGGILISLAGMFFVRLTAVTLIQGVSFSEFIATERLAYYSVGLIISLVVLVVFYVFHYYKHTQQKKLKEQKIIAGTASAKFDALKNQLDPHFLFNSLNVLTSLIEENPEAATQFTTALSKVYRYVLEQKNKQLVTVAEELKFAQLYMSLIKMRFEDSIIFTVPKQISDPEARVVPLSLQLMLENAVKHNMVTPARKLHITIHEKDGNLIVTNNIQPKQVVKESSGVGLQNIKQRYFLLTDRPVNIQKNEKEFSIAIPMLTKETMTMRTQETYISEKKYERAKKQVEELKGFYAHLTIYLIMVPVFIYLNYKGGGFPWAVFPIAGWGLGVGGHAMEVFGYNPILGKDWEERKIREYMDKEE
jgi:Ca2+/Na+ antiporter